MPNSCHIFPYQLADGPANMAIDEAILDVAASGAEAAFLRTYGWTKPTLSLGYFQHSADFRADSRWSAVPTVRRITGGGAIWHHHELTYAVVVPSTHPLARPNTALYRAVHAAIEDVLASKGVRACRRGDLYDSRDPAQKRPLLCFTDSNEDDIVLCGIKFVGSAQRRRRGAILQQGSVLLVKSPRTPELTGICDVADVSAEPSDWSDRLQQGIPSALGLHAVACGIPDEVLSRAADLEQARYRDPTWTQRR
jgi:lipoate-protein ligase A